MRTLFFIAAVLLASPAFAQEGSSTEEPEPADVVSVTIPQSLLEEAASRIVPSRTGRMSMVGARVCAFREYDIPASGHTLRLLTGECLEDRDGRVHNYVRDPETSRIRIVSDAEALEMLELLAGDPGALSASR